MGRRDRGGSKAISPLSDLQRRVGRDAESLTKLRHAPNRLGPRHLPPLEKGGRRVASLQVEFVTRGRA